MNTYTPYIVFTLSLLLCILLVGCGPKAGQRADVTKDILNHSRIGAAIGNEVIAKRYAQTIDLLEKGLISPETFSARRARLDTAEDALKVYLASVLLLEKAIDSREANGMGILQAVLDIVAAINGLHSAMVAADIPIPQPITDFLTFLAIFSPEAGGSNE